jgi:hypothetical protein
LLLPPTAPPMEDDPDFADIIAVVPATCSNALFSPPAPPPPGVDRACSLPDDEDAPPPPAPPPPPPDAAAPDDVAVPGGMSIALLFHLLSLSRPSSSSFSPSPPPSKAAHDDDPSRGRTMRMMDVGWVMNDEGACTSYSRTLHSPLTAHARVRYVRRLCLRLLFGSPTVKSFLVGCGREHGSRAM